MRTSNLQQRTPSVEPGNRILRRWRLNGLGRVWVANFGSGAFSSGLRRFSSHFKRYVYGVMTLAGMGFSTQGAELRFTWRANGEADLAGYKLYQGAQPGVWTNAIVVLAPATNFTLRVEGENYFALSAFDIAGRESDLTAPLVYRAPARPGVPGGFEGAASWLITDSSCDFVLWEAAITNEAPMIWPLEFYRLRMERSALR